MVVHPDHHDCGPDRDFMLWICVSHEPKFELLQGLIEELTEDVVNCPDLFEQCGVKRLVADRSRPNLAGVDEFGIGHGGNLSEGQQKETDSLRRTFINPKRAAVIGRKIPTSSCLRRYPIFERAAELSPVKYSAI